MWWYIPLPALRRLRHEDGKLKGWPGFHNETLSQKINPNKSKPTSQNTKNPNIVRENIECTRICTGKESNHFTISRVLKIPEQFTMSLFHSLI